MASGCRKYVEGEDYLCAVKDLLTLPKIDKYSFPWDIIFLGTKSSDDIHITKQHEIQSAAVKFGSKMLIYPLHNWTDNDVWDYVNRYDLKVQKDRYENDPSGHSGSAANDFNNPDAAPTCYACLDYKSEGQDVFCPRSGALIAFRGKGKAAAEAANKQHVFMMRGIIGKGGQ